MGVPFLPYAILDGIAAPRPCNPPHGKSSQGEFSEAIVRLPHSYFANSYSSAFPLDDRLFQRTAAAAAAGSGDGDSGGSPNHLPEPGHLGPGRSGGGSGGEACVANALPTRVEDGGEREASGASALPARADVGLPEVGVVYCCTNQLYKLDPGTFAMW